MPTETKSGAKPATAKSKVAAPKKAAAKTVAKAETKAVMPKKPAAKAATKAAVPKVAAEQTANEAPQISPEQRRCYVEVAAYYIAERRGFQGGDPEADWLAAEAEIDRLLREGVLKP